MASYPDIQPGWYFYGCRVGYHYEFDERRGQVDKYKVVSVSKYNNCIRIVLVNIITNNAALVSFYEQDGKATTADVKRVI